jgi:hypothetical protein
MKLFYWAIFLFSMNTLVVGCGMQHEIVSNMDEAYSSAIKMQGDTQKTREAAVTSVVHKYFYPKMQKDVAFALLMELKKDDFEIKEYRNEGVRTWPDGVLKPYLNKDTSPNRQAQYPDGMSEFFATRKYVSPFLIVNKTVTISFKVVGSSTEIQDVTGRLSFSGL